MIQPLIPLVLLALLPAMVGPLPQAGAKLKMPLCNGGTMELPLPAPAPGTQPCCAKGCRSSDRRSRIDRAQ